MTKIKLLSIAVIGLLLVNLGTLAFIWFNWGGAAMGPGQRPEPGRERPKKIIIDRLHFDQAQVAQYEPLIRGHQDAVRLLETDIRETRQRLYQTLTEASSNGKDSLASRLGALQKQMEETHYMHFAGIRKLCRPGQVEYFNALSNDLAKLFGPEKKMLPPPRD